MMEALLKHHDDVYRCAPTALVTLQHCIELFWSEKYSIEGGYPAANKSSPDIYNIAREYKTDVCSLIVASKTSRLRHFLRQSKTRARTRILAVNCLSAITFL
jgi:hypothetical protein